MSQPVESLTFLKNKKKKKNFRVQTFAVDSLKCPIKAARRPHVLLKFSKNQTMPALYDSGAEIGRAHV